MIAADTKRAIALGFFDGVHLGHKALMERAKLRARENGAVSSVFTMDVHPDSIVSGTPVPLITANAGRNEEIKRIGGVDEVIFAHFNDEMMHLGWQEFIRELLVKRFNACWIVTGENNHFGYRGEGTPEKLQQECKKLGIGCDTVENVEIDGILVSSTYIRTLIASGEMERATRFLGHPYTISGPVRHGRRVGRTLGVPTVNLALPPEMQAPPYGVYASRVFIDDTAYLAATNIGLKPTFVDGGAPTIEPHLLNFNGDLYGKFVRIELCSFLRPERRWETIEELKQAIAGDIQQTVSFFAKD